MQNCKMRPDFCTANVSVIVNYIWDTHSFFSKGVQTNKQNCITIRLIEKKTVIVHYREVRLESCHVAEMQRNQTNKQTNNQTIWWENHRCALPKRKTRESPCCRNETWLFALLMSALLSIAEMAKLRNLVQCCSARWRSRGAEKLFIHKVIWKV